MEVTKKKLYSSGILLGLICLIIIYCIAFGQTLNSILVFFTYPYMINMFLTNFVFSIIFITLSTGVLIYFTKEVHKYNKKISGWFIASIIFSFIAVIVAHNIILSNYPDQFPSYTTLHSIDNESLRITYNLLNNANHLFALRGDLICFNVSAVNGYNTMIHLYFSSQIKTPDWVFIPENHSYTATIVNFESNTTRTANGNLCGAFTSVGQNTFLLRIQKQDIYGITYDLRAQQVPVYVYSETEYNNIQNQRNLALILSLGLIPIVVSTVKSLRDLYEK